MGKYTLPEMPYKYDALEPHIDARTMEIKLQLSILELITIIQIFLDMKMMLKS